MTRTEMIAFIKKNPNVRISHPLFSNDEYIFSKEDGNVYDESGYLFENWYSPNDLRGWNGIRMRTGSEWEDGWYIAEREIKLKLSESEFNMIVDKLKWMRCIVGDSNNLDYQKYCNGKCGSQCNRPDLCNFEKWLESKIVD